MEVWKTIKGYEGYYEISNLGRVKSLARLKKGAKNITYLTKDKILKQNFDKDGYFLINLCKNSKLKTFKIHRLVADCFIKNIDNKKQVNHINGIKNDNRVENLEWCTQSENMTHALRTGLKIPLKGENCKVSKLTEKIVIEILTKKKESNGKKNWGAKEIALKYNIKQGCISEVASRRNWKHIEI